MLKRRGSFFKTASAALDEGVCLDIVSHNRKPWILVVDDHDLSRQSTVQALRQITRHVKQVGNGREALRQASLLRPELIFLDLHLPDTDGCTLLTKIRSAWPADSPKPGCVILTGDSLADVRQAFNWPAGTMIMTKPARHRAIRELASRHLSRFHGVQESEDKGATGVSPPGLYDIFLRDLGRQCPLLDRHISELEWQSARNVLHQMIAGSAMCDALEIERYCRLLNDELAGSCHPKPLAHAYFGLLRAIEQARNGHHD